MTGSGFEIDFFVVRPDGQRLAIQVCAAVDAPATLEREVRALVDIDPSTDLLLLTLYREDRLEIQGRSISVLPAWKWLLSVEE